MTGTFRKITTPPYSEQQKQIAGQEQQIAGTQQQYGQTLEQPLVTGRLPPGQQASVDLALKNAIDTIKGRFAGLNLSGSSMEADAVGYAMLQNEALKGTLEEAMASLGLSATGQATGALGAADTSFSNLATAQISEDSALEQAIAGFAGAAVGGKTPGIGLHADKSGPYFGA